MPRHVEGGPWVSVKLFKIGYFHGWVTFRSRLNRNREGGAVIRPLHMKNYWCSCPPSGVRSAMHRFRGPWVGLTVYRSSEWKIKIG